MKLKEALNRCKEGWINVKEYSAKQKVYRLLLKKKKEDWGDKLLEEMNMNRSEWKFWILVNENRKSRA